MKLITEHNDQNLEYLSESNEKGEKKVYISGVFMEAERKNRNNRVYPEKILSKAVGKYVKEQVQTGRAVGELNHPEGPGINLDKVSHRITDLFWEGNNVMGKALILDTPMGKIVKGLIEGGCKLGVSSRGMGSVSTMEGKNLVQDDFILSTVDIVQDPSAPSAFVEGIMEGVEYFMQDGQLMQKRVDEIKKFINKTSKRSLAEAQVIAWKYFLDGLK